MTHCHSVTLIVQNVCMMCVVRITVITVVVGQPADCCFSPSISTSRTPDALNYRDIHSHTQPMYENMLKMKGCPSSPGSGHLLWYCYGAGGCRDAVHDVLEVLGWIQVWGIGWGGNALIARKCWQGIITDQTEPGPHCINVLTLGLRISTPVHVRTQGRRVWGPTKAFLPSGPKSALNTHV